MDYTAEISFRASLMSFVRYDIAAKEEFEPLEHASPGQTRTPLGLKPDKLIHNRPGPSWAQTRFFTSAERGRPPAGGQGRGGGERRIFGRVALVLARRRHRALLRGYVTVPVQLIFVFGSEVAGGSAAVTPKDADLFVEGSTSIMRYSVLACRSSFH